MKVFLTGGNGMLGQSLQRLAKTLAPGWRIHAPGRSDLDLTDRENVRAFYAAGKFDLVIHAAAKVGGIKANMADQSGFLAENILINTHVIEEARRAAVPRLINFGSSCMYPCDYRNPLSEEDILAAPLDPTNEGYAIAKIAAARLCAYIGEQYGLAYKTFIPCNLYGPADQYDSVNGHVLAAIILKLHRAVAANDPSVEIWGDGTVRREFLFVDDLAVFVLKNADKLPSMPAVLNTGSGKDHAINDYYRMAADIIGFKGEFRHDLSAPVGMTRKLMDSSKAARFGWAPFTSLEDGIRKAYDDFLATRRDQLRHGSSISL